MFRAVGPNSCKADGGACLRHFLNAIFLQSAESYAGIYVPNLARE